MYSWTSTNSHLYTRDNSWQNDGHRFSLSRWPMYSLLQWPQAPPLHKGQEPLYYSLTSLNGHLPTLATFLSAQGNLIPTFSLPAPKSKERGRCWKSGCPQGVCLAGVVERCNLLKAAALQEPSSLGHLRKCFGCLNFLQQLPSHYLLGS